MWIAKPKQATTIVTQETFAGPDFALEICNRPWIVELSRKAEISFAAIFMKVACIKVFNLALESIGGQQPT